MLNLIPYAVNVQLLGNQGRIKAVIHWMSSPTHKLQISTPQITNKPIGLQD